MAKISANYEVVFIMDGRLPEEQVAALTEKFKTLVEQNSTAMEVEEWGKRKLAYAINYITEGYYVLISFTSAPVRSLCSPSSPNKEQRFEKSCPQGQLFFRLKGEDFFPRTARRDMLPAGGRGKGAPRERLLVGSSGLE